MSVPAGVPAGVVVSGAEVVLHLERELAGLSRFVVRIPPSASVMMAIALGSVLSKHKVVQTVADPTLEMGQAAWMPAFKVPWRAIIVLAGDEDEVLRWTGPRGLSYGLSETGTSVFGTWHPDDLERLTTEWHGQGVAATMLKGWQDRFGCPEQLDVEMLLHPGWTPSGVPAGWAPVSEDDRRGHVETMLLEVVSRFGGQTILASPAMEQMLRELADAVDGLAREGWLPKPEKVASAPEQGLPR